MYGYEWTDKYGIFKLSVTSKIEKEIRPVFKEELDFFNMDRHWSYPETDAPLLWAEGIRRYVLNGECVAEAKGGGFYTKPKIELRRTGISLQPIDIDALWKANESIMKGLEQRAILFIRDKYDEFVREGYEFIVAFSGGKDSLLLLDLASKALSPDQFRVIFSNTGMELKSTLEAVELAKRRWANLEFHEARSHMSPDRTWDEFGPPGRRLRWCCAVHKSVPTILKLREITGNYNVRAVVFDGVRAEESAARSQYDEVSFGKKNISQVNCSPVLKWNGAEVFLYLLKNNIIINNLYRQGLFRVGCKICPMASLWWDSISNTLYPTEMENLLQRVEYYASTTKSEKEQKKFIEQGGWKGRIGGRGLKNGGNRVNEKIESNRIILSFTLKKQDWLRMAPIIGPIIDLTDNSGSQLIKGKEFNFSIDESNGLVVTYSPFSQMDRSTLSLLRGVANKVAYCIGCKACVVQCPVGAFTVLEDGQIFIREDRCVHCGNCITFAGGKGCLVAKSLATTLGGNGMNLKGMNRYQHFGFRRGWLEHYFEHGNDCFSTGQLGNRQYDALKVWLRESELMTPPNKGEKSGSPTALAERLKILGAYNPLTWAVIWSNLAYSSIIVKWYMLKVPSGETYEKADLVSMLGDDYSQSTRDNAVTSLLEIMRHSPVGSTLKQGIPIPVGRSHKFVKEGWETPDSAAMLYSLYLWAEKTGRYAFTLTQLSQARSSDESLGMDPVSIFGLNPDDFKDILQELALHYDKYIRVSFVADLDNVRLSPEISSVDILDLVIESDGGRTDA